MTTVVCTFLIAGLAACGGGENSSTGSDEADNTPETPPVSSGPIEGDYSQVGAPARSFNENTMCAIGSPEGTRQNSNFRYDKVGSIMEIKVGNLPTRQVSQKGTWQREFHQSSISHAIDVNANNYRRVWMTIHNDGRFIGGGMNGKIEANTIYCGEALRDPEPEAPSTPPPAPDLSAPNSYDAFLKCAVGSVDGPLLESRFRYEKPTQFMTITRGDRLWQAIAMGTWSRQTHAASSSYAVDANGPGVRRFWLGVGTNGQLIGGGMNGIAEADSIYCGLSANGG